MVEGGVVNERPGLAGSLLRRHPAECFAMELSLTRSPDPIGALDVPGVTPISPIHQAALGWSIDGADQLICWHVGEQRRAGGVGGAVGVGDPGRSRVSPRATFEPIVVRVAGAAADYVARLGAAPRGVEEPAGIPAGQVPLDLRGVADDAQVGQRPGEVRRLFAVGVVLEHEPRVREAVRDIKD